MSFTANNTGGEYSHTLTTDEMPSHYHTFGTADKQNNIVTGWTDYGYTMRTGSSYNITKGTSSTGGGSAHNNLSPYIVVYFWRRTA